MTRLPVESTFLNSIGYDPAKQLLEVEFAKGKIFQYQDVPPDVALALEKAESKGRFFQKNISGKFQSSELPT